MNSTTDYFQIEGQKDWKDQLAAMRLSMATPINWLSAVSAYLLAGVGILIGLLSGSTSALLIWVIMLAAFLWLHFSPPYRIRRNFEKDPASKELFTIIVAEQGIEYSSEAQKGEWQWKIISRWRSNDEVTLLYLPSRAFIIIPHRLVESPETIESLQALLRQHDIPEYNGPLVAQIVGIVLLLGLTTMIALPVIVEILK